MAVKQKSESHENLYASTSKFRFRQVQSLFDSHVGSDGVAQIIFSLLVTFCSSLSSFGFVVRFLAFWTHQKAFSKAPEGVSLHILAGVMFLIDISFQFGRLSVLLVIISWACAFDVLQKNLEDHLEKSKYRSHVQRFSFQMVFHRIAEILRNLSKIVQEEESISGRAFCIANEIFTTEKTFVKSLQVIKEVYADPMENILSYDDSFMTKNSWKTIFQNFPAILKLHEKILEDMEEVLKKGKIKGKEDLGKFLYSKYNAEIVEFYTLYMNSYDRKTKELENLQTSEKFSSFLASQISNSKSDGRPLDALLIRPIQRLPSVLLLLKDFHRELQKQDSKYSSTVETSYEQMKLILERLNKEKGIDEGRQKLLNLATRVENFPQGIVSAERILLESASITVEQDISIDRNRLSKGKSSITFHLMSDMIILTKTKTKSVGLKRSKIDTELFVGLIKKENISQIFQVNSNLNIGIYFSENDRPNQLFYFSVLGSRDRLVGKLKNFEKYKIYDDFTPKSPVRARSKSFDRAALVRRSFDFQKKINLEI
ncbi:unnamed protein product [Oikopleura dioica]|uniref:DH domain-containing protein n=1 Tax=Oikopleura dioica TaxID=34765 RepID=E4WUG9_OIKDI|nr:unnamed protein product [Oikopleura dioica]